jgi:glycosyltransferase involved in cell wall biosynthesis
MKLSVIMPFFNRPQYMRQAMDSFVDQSINGEFGSADDIELVAVNNGGTIPEYIGEYRSKIKHFVLVDKTAGNSITPINTGILRSSGEWITQLHDDDTLTPDSIQTRLEYIKAAEKLGIEVLCFGMHKMNNAGNRTGYYPALPISAIGMLGKELVPFAVMTWKASIIKRFGPLDESLPMQADYLFKIRCAMECSCASINIPVYNYRSHPGQESVRLRSVKDAETERLAQIVNQLYGGHR